MVWFGYSKLTKRDSWDESIASPSWMTNRLRWCQPLVCQGWADIGGEDSWYARGEGNFLVQISRKSTNSCWCGKWPRMAWYQKKRTAGTSFFLGGKGCERRHRTQKLRVWKMFFLVEEVIFRFHVKFRGSIFNKKLFFASIIFMHYFRATWRRWRLPRAPSNCLQRLRQVLDFNVFTRWDWKKSTRKLTWQWNIHHWRCISYWTRGFSNVSFQGCKYLDIKY